MAYRVILSLAAERQLPGRRSVNRIALRGVILALSRDPRPVGSTKLVGKSDLWRLRVRIDGRPWRVIYRIDDKRREIVIARIAPRDEATYRGV